MKKMILFAFIVFFVCSSNIKLKKKSFYQEQDNNILFWSSNKKLTWNDFQGDPDTINLMIKAQTFAGLKIENGYWQEGIPKINVICYFSKSKSWVKVKSDSNLAHEQLHFDIWELYARKIRKSFDSLNEKKIKDIKVYYSVFESYGEKCNKYNDFYDSKVYFNDERQQQWIENIAIELNQLKRYEYILEE
ncbi:hypothetical protein [Flavobacterium sp. PS2]|uniref:hypothetical protein n=1 Tax=Flavobacterium sp. PS2 TaxID=3384157 RepID=UPI00390C99D1